MTCATRNHRVAALALAMAVPLASVLLFCKSSMAYLEEEFILCQGKEQTCTVWKDPAAGIAFVWVPGGCYGMGSDHGNPDETPVHEVCVDDFWMSVYEVTNAQYRQFAPRHDSGSSNGRTLNGDRQPAVRISWKEAKAFADWLSSRGKSAFRLPTEAEWEYAARLGSDIGGAPGGRGDSGEGQKARPGESAKGQSARLSAAAPVDSVTHDGLCLYGMQDSVGELCEDVYNPAAYAKHQRSNPVYRNFLRGYSVVRGGSWRDGPVPATTRGKLSAQQMDATVGFRLVMTR